MSARGGSKGRKKRPAKDDYWKLMRAKEHIKSLEVGTPEWLKTRDRILALEKLIPGETP